MAMSRTRKGSTRSGPRWLTSLTSSMRMRVHLPSLTLAALITGRSARPPLCSVLECLVLRRTRLTRFRCLGTAGLLAISPPMRFITLERPASQRAWLFLLSLVWRYDMSWLRRSQRSAVTRFGFPSLYRHHSPVGPYQVVGDFVPYFESCYHPLLVSRRLSRK